MSDGDWWSSCMQRWNSAVRDRDADALRKVLTDLRDGGEGEAADAMHNTMKEKGILS